MGVRQDLDELDDLERKTKLTLDIGDAITIFSLMERSVLTFGKISDRDIVLAKKIFNALNEREKSVLSHSHEAVIVKYVLDPKSDIGRTVGE